MRVFPIIVVPMSRLALPRPARLLRAQRPALSLALLLLLAGSATAGNLAETARGVDHKSSSDSKSSSSSDKDHQSDHSSSDSWTDNSSYASCLLCEDTTSGPMIVLPAPDFDLRVSAQKVRDSDGSFHIDTAVSAGPVGLYSAFDYYFEHIESGPKMAPMSDDVRVNLFEVSGFARFVQTDVVSADLRLGFAAAASSHFDTLPGGVAGVRLLARANDKLALSAEARVMRYSHEISAMEAMAGAQVSTFWLGYRALKFDVGPVLEGPEAGVHFRF